MEKIVGGNDPEHVGWHRFQGMEARTFAMTLPQQLVLRGEDDWTHSIASSAISLNALMYLCSNCGLWTKKGKNNFDIEPKWLIQKNTII